MEKNNSIKNKFFLRVVPIVVIMIFISYILTVFITIKLINSRAEENINAHQKIEVNVINNYLDKKLMKANDLSIFVQNSYKFASINAYEKLLMEMVDESDNILGAGIWFEPYKFDKNKKYLGIYSYEVDGVVELTYKYNSQGYDYFNHPYYYMAKESHKPIFTEPYFDEESKLYMISFSAPIEDEDKNFIGCVTVDIQLTDLKLHLQQYDTNESSLYIINKNGVFVTHDDISFAENRLSALDSNNESYLDAINYILNNEKGIVTYKKNATDDYRLYFNTITELNWKIIFEVSVDEIISPVEAVTFFYFIISVVTIVGLIIAIIMTVDKNILNPIKRLLKEFEEVAKNDYTSEVSKDLLLENKEFKILAKSFEDMKKKLKSHEKELFNKMKDIEYLSYCDQLTGLRNRRYTEKLLERLIKEKEYPISIIVADLNGLKLINDAFGHDKGDELLNNFADVLRQLDIDEDYLSKTGGDEFMIYLPRKKEEDARELVKQINTYCKTKIINGIPLTASLGVCTLKDENDNHKEIIKLAENDMYRNKIYTAASRRKKSIDLIISTLHDKSEEEKEHSKRVSKISKKIGKALNFTEVEEEKLGMAGLLHDIGKIGIFDDFLNTQEKLTIEEYEEMTKHSEIGYRILKALGNMNDISEIIFAHHENWDGTGYPRQLKGEAIPIEARIIHLADAYDSMTKSRRYKELLTNEEAKKEILKYAGTQFDKDIVKVFVNKVMDDL